VQQAACQDFDGNSREQVYVQTDSEIKHVFTIGIDACRLSSSARENRVKNANGTAVIRQVSRSAIFSS
jgi:hypothetical protein